MQPAYQPALLSLLGQALHHVQPPLHCDDELLVRTCE